MKVGEVISFRSKDGEYWSLITGITEQAIQVIQCRVVRVHRDRKKQVDIVDAYFWEINLKSLGIYRTIDASVVAPAMIRAFNKKLDREQEKLNQQFAVLAQLTNSEAAA